MHQDYSHIHQSIVKARALSARQVPMIAWYKSQDADTQEKVCAQVYQIQTFDIRNLGPVSALELICIRIAILLDWQDIPLLKV